MSTLDQRRARHIHNFLRQAESGLLPQTASNADRRRTFVAAANALPAAILINGFGMAIATMLAQHKDGDPEYLVTGMLADWLIAYAQDNGSPYQQGPATPRGLLDHIIDGKALAYVLAQGEALAYLAWLKVLAKPLRPEKSQRENGQAETEPDAAQGGAPP